MPITVRLEPTLEDALDRYCAAEGVTRSLVVQESLARYLAPSANAADAAPTAPDAVSRNLKAFQQAGLIGCIQRADGDAPRGPADKAAVRAAARARLQRSTAA
jgi:predicted transcriptional regulator